MLTSINATHRLSSSMLKEAKIVLSPLLKALKINLIDVIDDSKRGTLFKCSLYYIVNSDKSIVCRYFSRKDAQKALDLLNLSAYQNLKYPSTTHSLSIGHCTLNLNDIENLAIKHNIQLPELKTKQLEHSN